MANTKREFNRRRGNIRGSWSEWLNINQPVHLRGMKQRTGLTGTRGNSTRPRGADLRSFETSQASIPKPVPTFKGRALTWKATSLIFVQDHPTIFPGQ